ncbi:MAG: hypothetical protein JW837_05375 [Sedimentisphaerales bacterium]|nr:hypothetical protein [Sedimentisphaerales bacterium]
MGVAIAGAIIATGMHIVRRLRAQKTELDISDDGTSEDRVNPSPSDDKLIDSWVSRKMRNEKTWPLEREIQQRPGLMDRCLIRLHKAAEAQMPDLDPVRDSKHHDDFNEQLSDQELIDIWVSRKIRNKKTWQMERQIAKRPGLMDRCLNKLKEIRQSGQQQ